MTKLQKMMLAILFMKAEILPVSHLHQLPSNLDYAKQNILEFEHKTY